MSSSPRHPTWPAAGLGLLLLVPVGCGHGLCEAATPAADIFARLAEGWPDTQPLLITVSCPPRDECGFLDGPVSGPAPVRASTVLRPRAVDVTVTEEATGLVQASRHVVLTYEPIGLQTECTGAAQAFVTVPPP